MTELAELEGRQGGRVETREATVSSVSYPDRTIDLVVIPYESPTVVGLNGRLVEEVVSRGAFGKVQQRAGRKMKVNRDHDPTKGVGYVGALYPAREEGLIAKLHVSRTPLGDETLVLADDGVLDASAGFGLLHDDNGRVYPDAEVWETRTRRRLNRLWLDHVALVSNPAYDGSTVLAVRSANETEPTPRPSTPNIDLLRLSRLEELEAEINKRYSL